MPQLTLYIPNFGKKKPRIAVCKAIARSPFWSILYDSKGQSEGEIHLYFQKNARLIVRVRHAGSIPWELDLGTLKKDTSANIQPLMIDHFYRGK
jgi:hypothetical protein